MLGSPWISLPRLLLKSRLLFSWWQATGAHPGFLSSQNCLHLPLSWDFGFPETVCRLATLSLAFTFSLLLLRLGIFVLILMEKNRKRETKGGLFKDLMF